MYRLESNLLVNSCLIFFMLSISLPAYSEVNTQAAEALTFQYKRGTCSLDEKSWCPTHAEAAEFGFIVNGVSTKGVRSLQLHFDNLMLACTVWKIAGGNENAQVMLRVVDEKNNTVLFVRNCSFNE